MSKMFAPAYLADQFGGGFNCSEIEHLLAIRGLLLMWMRDVDGGRWYNDLSDAVNEMNRRLSLVGVTDPSSAPRPPKTLFSHYLNHVSKEWDWLRFLAPSGWGH